MKPHHPPPQSKRAKGFTLVELLVVMLLIVVLAAIVLKALRGLEERSKVQQAKADVARLVMAIEHYHVNFGDYPTTLWRDLDQESTGRKDGRSYIYNWPKNRLGGSAGNRTYLDPWGRPYQYKDMAPQEQLSASTTEAMANAAKPGFSKYVYSWGPDGVFNATTGGFGADDIIGKIGTEVHGGWEAAGQ